MRSGRSARWHAPGEARPGVPGWSSARCRRLALRSVGGLAALTLMLATACSAGPGKGSPAQQHSSSTTQVSPDKAAALQLAGGLTVSVPRGTVAGRGVLQGKTTAAPGAAPRGMMLAGPTYDLHISRTRLTGRVQLTVPAPAPGTSGPAAGPDDALLAFYNTANGTWQPIAATYHPANHSLTATSPHLSLWSALRLDTGTVLSQARSLLKGFIGVADTTAQPSCPGAADLPADGITTASDKGNLVKWCAGVDPAGAPLLRVADNRSYAMETTYPSTWQSARTGPGDPVTQQIIDSVTRLLSPAPNGEATTIIPGGGTVQFTAPQGASGEVHTEPSAEGYLMDAFVYGADTLAMTMDDIPGAPKANATRTAKAIGLAFSAKDCLAQLDAITHNDVSSAHAVGDLFRSDVELAVGCLGPEWKTAYGLKGAVGSFIVKALLWLEDGIKLVINGLHAAIDSAIYWRSYRIALNSSAGSSLASYAGQWYVHGATLTIGSDGSGGMTWNAGPCSPDINVDEGMCTGHASIALKPSASGLGGTLTNVWYTASTGPLPSDFTKPAQPAANESFLLKRQNANVLYTTWYSNPTMNEGNGNWCRMGYVNSQVCGA